MKKGIIFTLAIAALGLLVLIFFMKNQRLSEDLNQSKLLAQKMQEEIRRLEIEQAKAKEESQKFKTDAVSYISLNTELQGKKEAAENKLKVAMALIKKKERELKTYHSKLSQLNDKLVQAKQDVDADITKQKDELQQKVDTLEASLKKERGIYHYNLAVAYTHAKFYDEAIIEYTKSLEFNPDNAEAHYNLGLIYSNARFNQEKTVAHYKKYLELKPDAYDKDEVKDWIKAAYSG